MNEAKNQKIHRTNVVVFCSILLLGAVLSLTMKKQEVSDMENRKLASFPEYNDSIFWKGKYFKGIEAWYADNFPFRDFWIRQSDRFRGSLGFTSSEIKIYEPVNNAEANEKDTTGHTDTLHHGPLPDDGAVGE